MQPLLSESAVSKRTLSVGARLRRFGTLLIVRRHDPSAIMKPLLVVAGLAALAAIAGGFTGIRWLLAAGAVVMLFALIALPWMRQDTGFARDRTDHDA